MTEQIQIRPAPDVNHRGEWVSNGFPTSYPAIIRYSNEMVTLASGETVWSRATAWVQAERSDVAPNDLVTLPGETEESPVYSVETWSGSGFVVIRL